MTHRFGLIAISALCLVTQIACLSEAGTNSLITEKITDRNAAGTVTTVQVKAPFQDVVWEKERLTFYLPCGIADDTSKAGDESQSEATSIREFACRLNTITYSVSLTKSKNDVQPEFEKLQKTPGTKSATVNGMRAVDQVVTKSGTTTFQVEGHPDTASYFSEVTKSRTYLVDNNRTVTLKAECKTPEDGYCERLIGGTNEVTLKFFDTLKINK